MTDSFFKYFVAVSVFLVNCQHVDTKLQTPDRKGNILFYLPVVPKSTVMAIKPILRALDRRGHNVTLITFVPKAEQLTPANVKVIKLPIFEKIWNNMDSNLVPTMMGIS